MVLSRISLIGVFFFSVNFLTAYFKKQLVPMRAAKL
jgi:hypothetical protein